MITEGNMLKLYTRIGVQLHEGIDFEMEDTYVNDLGDRYLTDEFLENYMKLVDSDLMKKYQVWKTPYSNYMAQIEYQLK